jgi:hypothetical protein
MTDCIQIPLVVSEASSAEYGRDLGTRYVGIVLDVLEIEAGSRCGIDLAHHPAAS